MTMTKKEFASVTPGEMLKEEFLAEYGLSQNQLAKAIGISPNRITEIVNNRRRITADTALRLSLYFGNSPEFWMNLQSHYDLKIARSDLKAEEIKRIKGWVARARSPAGGLGILRDHAGATAGSARGTRISCIKVNYTLNRAKYRNKTLGLTFARPAPNYFPP
jgi:antitoxin HigA-1